MSMIKKIKNAFKIIRKHGKEILSWVFKIGVTLLFAFVFVFYFGRQISVAGNSMKPVADNGDTVLINTIVYNAFRPKRGDVIAFRPKGNENSHYYVRRVIGLPGETIELIEGEIYINEVKLEESYQTKDIAEVGRLKEPLTLADDEYFVLGDNRENNDDSRSANVGNVKRGYMYGKAWLCIDTNKRFHLIRRD
ncbi:signal peptidase I [Lachnospiraceae bacterium PF1-21]